MSFGFGFGFPKNYVAATLAPFTPAVLFTTGTNGAWYDPSDMTTLYQDAAGTTPVTAMEQPVGKLLDKSGRGNHAFNNSGNSANFPVLSARYNLLTKTEDFGDSSAWPTSGGSVMRTPGFIDPLGGSTAWKIVFGGANNEFRSAGSLPANSLNCVWIKGTSGETIACGAYNGVLTLDGNWQYVSAISASNYFWIGTWGGVTARTIYVWHPELKAPNDAVNLPYQRVNTASDYDTVGFKPYLKFNGTNQWLQTNSIDLSYTDKMFVSAGVRKLSDGSTYIVAELSQQFNINPGAFAIAYPVGSSLPQPAFGSNGTTSQLTYPASGYAAPITNVLSGVGNISGDQTILRANGSQVAINTGDQGTGNYGNYPLYMGTRAGSTVWFNGRLYQLVVAGKQASASEITNTETYINQKTGAWS